MPPNGAPEKTQQPTAAQARTAEEKAEKFRLLRDEAMKRWRARED